MSVAGDSPDLSVGQVLQRCRNMLAREFRHAVWVQGEVKTIREWRGNWYLTLIEPGAHVSGGDVMLDAWCSARRKALIEAQLRAAGLTLSAGLHVRLSGPVTLNKLGKVQVDVLTLDTEALLGAHALRKRQLVERLRKEGLFDRNRQLPVADVPLRVGLVGSEGSDGVGDFLGRLQRSPFDFAVTMAHSPVQGPAAATALGRAITLAGRQGVDVVVVVRGGGGELDAFDAEPVALAIARCPVPVWTGIGHTADHSVADAISNATFVTPTACGDALVAKVEEFRARAYAHADSVAVAVDRLMTQSVVRVASAQRNLMHAGVVWAQRQRHGLRQQLAHAQRSAARQLEARRHALLMAQQRSRDLVGNAVARDAQHVAALRRNLRLVDPARQLERGYVVLRNASGHLVRDVSDVRVGDVVHASLRGGVVAAAVQGVEVQQNTTQTEDEE